MKALLIMVLAGFSAVSSAAILESTTSTCADLRAAVQRNGWEIIQTNGQPAGNKAAYAIFYAHRSDIDQVNTVALQGYVQAADGNCQVGYVAVSKDSLYGLSHN